MAPLLAFALKPASKSICTCSKIHWDDLTPTPMTWHRDHLIAGLPWMSTADLKISTLGLTMSWVLAYHFVPLFLGPRSSHLRQNLVLLALQQGVELHLLTPAWCLGLHALHMLLMPTAFCLLNILGPSSVLRLPLLDHSSWTIFTITWQDCNLQDITFY